MHPAPPVRPAPDEARPRAGRPLVLIADDYPENRRLLTIYLREHYDLLEAATAEEALDLLREHPVALAILDLNFCDGMSGIDAVQQIRCEPGLAATRVLALTAYAYPDDRDRCIEAGFDDYISKPVFKAALLEKVATLLAPPPQGDGSTGEIGHVWITRKRD
ncbi:MAG TPA: response regulator [Rubricoccaceae bacterium]|nr:response regulator [Rubricoccaceae bacterium]